MEQDILYRRTKTERKLFLAPTVLRGPLPSLYPAFSQIFSTAAR